MDQALGTPIAERELICERMKRIVRVRLGAPRKAADIDWLCPYQIAGLKKSRVEAAYGVDAFQALMMALEGIRVRLQQADVICTWVGGEKGDSGFPRFVPAFFGATFSARFNRQIDRELTRFGKAIRSKRKSATRRKS
jgi:hypothetical protein